MLLHRVNHAVPVNRRVTNISNVRPQIAIADSDFFNRAQAVKSIIGKMRKRAISPAPGIRIGSFKDRPFDFVPKTERIALLLQFNDIMIEESAMFAAK